MLKGYIPFNWPEFFVFIFIGLLCSGFLGYILQLPYIVAFPLGYSAAYFFSIKYFQRQLIAADSIIDDEVKKVAKLSDTNIKTEENLNNIIQYTMDMELYNEMTREDAIKHLKKITKKLDELKEKIIKKNSF